MIQDVCVRMLWQCGTIWTRKIISDPLRLCLHVLPSWGRRLLTVVLEAIAFLELLRWQQARNVYARGLLFDYCARSILPEVTAAMIVRNRNHFYPQPQPLLTHLR